jgi:glycosyltransferase involved in cell wall biosynthesis
MVVLDDLSVDVDNSPRPIGQCEVAHLVKVKQLSSKGLVGKVRWALDPRSTYPHGCGADKETSRRILQMANTFDLVWFYKLRTANMFAQSGWPHSVVDVDDVPSTFEHATLQQNGHLQDQILTRLRVFSLRRRERLLPERFTVLSVCSKADQAYLREMGIDAPIHVIPNGFDPPRQNPVRRPATPPRIGFSGIFDYPPNVDGIRWFVDKCWPHIKREIPGACLRIAGRGSDGPLAPAGPGIDRLGWIPDLDAEIATWSLMIVPLFVGAGTRVKIALGFSRECPIVSTTLGAHGYEVDSEEELILADKPDAFADACLRLIRQPELGVEMAKKAKRKFLKNWTWESIRPRIWAAAEDCLRRSENDRGRARNDHATEIL